MLAHWDLSSLAIFGNLSQPMQSSSCLHTGEKDLENGADLRPPRTEVSKPAHRPNPADYLFWYSWS